MGARSKTAEIEVKQNFHKLLDAWAQRPTQRYSERAEVSQEDRKRDMQEKSQRRSSDGDIADLASAFKQADLNEGGEATTDAIRLQSKAMREDWQVKVAHAKVPVGAQNYKSDLSAPDPRGRRAMFF